MATTLSGMNALDLVDFAYSSAMFGLASLTAALGFASGRRVSRYLSAFFLCFALAYLVDTIIGGWHEWLSVAAIRWLHTVNVPSAYLLGPLLYLYATALTSARARPSAGHLFRHALPGLAVLLFSVGNALLAFDRTQTGQRLFLITYHAWVVQSAPYLALSVWRTRHARPLLEQVSADEAALRLSWLRWLVVLMASGWVLDAIDRVPGTSDVAAWHGFDTALGVLIAIALYFLAWFGLRQRILIPAELVENPVGQESSGALPYARSGLDHALCANIAADLVRLLEREHLYADSQLDLHTLSRRSGWQPHYISQALNQGLGWNFFEFINGFRVDAAKRCLIDAGDRRTILDIGLACGFGSKSTFNTVFKRMTGTTPGQVRRSGAHEADPASI